LLSRRYIFTIYFLFFYHEYNILSNLNKIIILVKISLYYDLTFVRDLPSTRNKTNLQYIRRGNPHLTSQFCEDERL